MGTATMAAQHPCTWRVQSWAGYRSGCAAVKDKLGSLWPHLVCFLCARRAHGEPQQLRSPGRPACACRHSWPLH